MPVDIGLRRRGPAWPGLPSLGVHLALLSRSRNDLASRFPFADRLQHSKNSVGVDDVLITNGRDFPQIFDFSLSKA
jgi:hypothetical protein